MKVAISKRNEAELAIKLVSYWKEGLERIRALPGRVWISQDLIWSVPYTLEGAERMLRAFADAELQVDPVLIEECYLFQDYEECNGPKATPSSSH